MCLSCHSDPQMSVMLPSGETRSLAVDREVFARSVHGGKLGCVDCHTGMTEVPHPPRPFKTKREFTIAYHEACKRCHFANYSKTLDSVHYAPRSRGRHVTAPVCVDCHGAHDITRAGPAARRASRETCARCHQGVSRDLREERARPGADRRATTPTCRRAPTATARTTSPARTLPGGGCAAPSCAASCHANEAMMKKYGLSTNVMQTYLADFHGMTASLQKKRDGARASAVVALCIDCHGVHDITKADDEGVGGDAGEPPARPASGATPAPRRTSRRRGCRTTSRPSRRPRWSTPCASATSS